MRPTKRVGHRPAGYVNGREPAAQRPNSTGDDHRQYENNRDQPQVLLNRTRRLARLWVRRDVSLRSA
ncbi:MAG: hypothetical protein KDA47_19325, partial [Planctomycetales bacterium]|nr:hypothetical protein [Planctomycetales bacterium]